MAIENLRERPEITINFPQPELWRSVEQIADTTGMSPVPAVGLPVDVGAAGLPLGVQIIAPSRADHALVRVATCLTDRAGLTARCALPEEQ